MRPQDTDESTHAFAAEALAWPGFNDRGSLILPLPWFQRAYPLPDSWRIDGRTLARKDEFHLTLLSRREGALVRERLPVASVEACFRTHAWSLGAIGDCWYIGSPGSEKRSLIAECATASLNPFRAALSEAAGIALAEVLAHVTLFVDGSPNGIGLESVAEFLALDRRQVSVFPAVGG